MQPSPDRVLRWPRGLEESAVALGPARVASPETQKSGGNGRRVAVTRVHWFGTTARALPNWLPLEIELGGKGCNCEA